MTMFLRTQQIGWPKFPFLCQYLIPAEGLDRWVQGGEVLPGADGKYDLGGPFDLALRHHLAGGRSVTSDFDRT